MSKSHISAQLRQQVSKQSLNRPVLLQSRCGTMQAGIPIPVNENKNI